MKYLTPIPNRDAAGIQQAAEFHARQRANREQRPMVIWRSGPSAESFDRYIDPSMSGSETVLPPGSPRPEGLICVDFALNLYFVRIAGEPGPHNGELVETVQPNPAAAPYSQPE